MQQTKRVLSNIFSPILALGIVLSVWAIIAEAENKPLVLPQLNVIFDELGVLLAQASTYIAIGNTLLNTMEAFAVSVLLAIFLSILGVVFPPLHRILSPINTMLKATPTMAIILLSILWLDTEKCPPFIGFLIAFPLLYSLFRQSLLAVDKNLLEMAKVYKVSIFDRIKSIYIPSVLPNMIGSMQSVISLTIKVVIAGEILAYVNNTIGFEMQMANSLVETATLIAWTIAAIILSFLLELFFGLIKKTAEVKYGYLVK